MLNNLCWVVTRISIPEESAIERRVCAWWACSVLLDVKRTEELLRDQPADREKGI